MRCSTIFTGALLASFAFAAPYEKVSTTTSSVTKKPTSFTTMTTQTTTRSSFTTNPTTTSQSNSYARRSSTTNNYGYIIPSGTPPSAKSPTSGIVSSTPRATPSS